MRHRPCWIILQVSTLTVLLLAFNDNDSKCIPGIAVRRYTSYRVSTGEAMEIPCPVTFCNKTRPTISWFRVATYYTTINVSGNSRLKTKWKTLSDSKAIFYLVFSNVLKNDSGLYRCEYVGETGHSINVTIADTSEIANATHKNVIDTWMYLYSTGGIVAFVIIVIVISVVSMRGCKGKSRKETQTENQIMMMPVAKQPPPQHSPRGSPSQPLPSRRSAKRKTQPGQIGGGEERMTEDRGRQRDRVEEEPVLVYAALNQQRVARGGGRPRRPAEETSEYAAIRVV